MGTAARSPLSLIVWGFPLTLTAATGILGAMNPLYYFLMFLYGFVIASDIRFQQAVDKLTWIALAFGLVAAVTNVVLPVERYASMDAAMDAVGPAVSIWALDINACSVGPRASLLEPFK